jgi:hypothetical protein
MADESKWRAWSPWTFRNLVIYYLIRQTSLFPVLLPHVGVADIHTSHGHKLTVFVGTKRGWLAQPQAVVCQLERFIAQHSKASTFQLVTEKQLTPIALNAYRMIDATCPEALLALAA